MSGRKVWWNDRIVDESEGDLALDIFNVVHFEDLFFDEDDNWYVIVSEIGRY